MLKGYFYIAVLLVVFVFIVEKYFKKQRKAIFWATLPALLFIKLSEDVIRNDLNVFDSAIYNYLASYISNKLTGIAIAITYMGSAEVLTFIAIIIYLVLRKNEEYAVYGKAIGANLAITWIFNEIFKVIFHRQRPDILRLMEAAGYSFPSGHSMVSMSFYGLIAYFLYKIARDNWIRLLDLVTFGILILLIGVSRVYLGVHYASDVIAGFSAGFAWIVIYITLINRYFLNKKLKLHS